MFNPPDYSARHTFLNPKFGPWTVVLYLHRKAILKSLISVLPQLKGKVLDVGCGQKPYLSLIKCEEYIGVDISSSPHSKNSIDFIFDGLNLPFEDNIFDSIICTEVIEHCIDPITLFAEMFRVLKEDGVAFITAPMFIEHHEIPYDMRRITYYGFKSLAENAGFKVDKIDNRGNYISVFIHSYYIFISQLLSRRPFSDVIYWILAPISYILYFFDSKIQKKIAVISLGWQMVVRK